MNTFLRAIARLGGRFLLAISLVYLLVLLILVPLWSLAPDLNGLVALSNILAPYLFVPLLLVLPLALLLRSRWLLLGSGGLLLLGVVLFGPGLLPAHPRPEVPPALRVVTFNQMYGNRTLDPTFDLLLAQNADIIALQEVSSATLAFLNDAPSIAERYPYQAFQANETARFPGTVGLLSRYPIESFGRLHGLRGMHATLTIDGTDVTVINIHPTPPSGRLNIQLPFSHRDHIHTFDSTRRNQQLAAVLDRVRLTEEPLIVAGDFNTSEREPIYQAFDALLHDAFRETAWGPGFTYSNNGWGRGHAYSSLLPRLRIDYIWSGGGLVPVAAYETCAYVGSDHCMVVADLGWK